MMPFCVSCVAWMVLNSIDIAEPPVTLSSSESLNVAGSFFMVLSIAFKIEVWVFMVALDVMALCAVDLGRACRRAICGTVTCVTRRERPPN